jgi:hypothetical protein
LNKTAILLGIISILAALFWNELNVASFEIHSQKLSHGHTVKTADDASYLAPAENWINGRGFRNNLIGKYAYYMRPPGYSLVYSIFRVGLMTKHALYSLKFLQLFLFGISIGALFLLMLEIGLKKNISIFLSSFYGIGGIGIGFLYYTLTEAITPALVIFVFYFLLKAKHSETIQAKRKYYILSFIIFGCLFITRPALGIMTLPIPIVVFCDQLLNFKQRAFLLFTFLLFGFGPMLLWQLRAFKISGEIVGLHPIYSIENKQTPYRPVHKAFWEFAKSWGETGEHFHSYTDEFWEKNYQVPSDSNSVQVIVQKMPNQVKNELGENILKTLFHQYRLAILDQRKFFDESLTVPRHNFKSENLAIENFNAYTIKYRKNHFFNYHFIAPLAVLKKMIFHSNLSLQIFQKTWRGNPLMEFWRIVNFLFHSLVFICLPVVLFFKTVPRSVKIIAFTLLLYLFFLAYFQRGIEERYTLPILPLAILSFGVVLQSLLKKVGRE